MFLSFHQTKLLRTYVNEEEDFPYKYFATMTWSQMEQDRMKAKVISDHPDWNENQVFRSLQEWRENQTLIFLRFVARKQNVHFSVLLSFELSENPHAHVIVMSHKKIKRKLWNKDWRHGIQRWFEDYNEHIRKTENGVVGYVMGWGNRYSFPPKHRNKGNTRVFCPLTSRRCKNGNCQHQDHFQQQLHHVINLSDEEEAERDEQWKRAGAWDLQEWNDQQRIRTSQSSVKPKTSQSTDEPGEKRLIGWRLRFQEIWDAQTSGGE
jgi:hypothetical protein